MPDWAWRARGVSSGQGCIQITVSQYAQMSMTCGPISVAGDVGADEVVGAVGVVALVGKPGLAASGALAAGRGPALVVWLVEIAVVVVSLGHGALLGAMASTQRAQHVPS